MTSIPVAAIAIAGGVITLGAIALAELFSSSNNKKKPKNTKVQYYMKFYHYTDRNGAYGIANSGQIMESTDTIRDAIIGPGVYVTDLPPSTSDEVLLRNNYDGSSQSRKKVAFYVELCAFGSKMQNFQKLIDPHKRRVYKHNGAILLSEYNGQVYER